MYGRRSRTRTAGGTHPVVFLPKSAEATEEKWLVIFVSAKNVKGVHEGMKRKGGNLVADWNGRS
jgi:hypothetical protein